MRSEMLSTLTDINFSFTKKNEQTWVLEHSEKFFIVSEEIKILLEILKRNHYNLENSYQDFIQEFDYVSNEDFDKIVKQNLKSLELDKVNSQQKKEKSFILFETKLISKENAASISKLLQPLFQPTFFWIVFTILFSLSIYNLTQMHHFHLEKEYMLLLFLLYLVSAFIHEFGHVAACNRFTKKKWRSWGWNLFHFSSLLFKYHAHLVCQKTRTNYYKLSRRLCTTFYNCSIIYRLSYYT